ncbi:hypothetical protein KC644_02945 [Candidatus Berkelbacteria bacterium]|nr:hypothetical protein [Candidatus Berkelbacteria bacterium]
MSKRLINTFIGVILITVIGYLAGKYWGSREVSVDLSEAQVIEPYVVQGEIKSFEDNRLVIFDRDLLQDVEYTIDDGAAIKFIDVNTEEINEEAGQDVLEPGRIASVRGDSDPNAELVLEVFTLPDYEKIKAETPEDQIVTE